MPFTLLFIIGSISERLFNIEFSFIRLGLGDIVVLLSLPYSTIVYGKIKSIFLKLAIFAFLVFLVSIILNVYNYGFNSLITVPLRIIVAGVIVNELLSFKKTSLWFSILVTIYLLIIISALFFSDGSPFQIAELFNRNELLIYSSTIVALSLFVLYKKDVTSVGGVGVAQISLLGFLILFAAIMHSRQSVLALAVCLIVLFLFLSFQKKVLYFFMMVMVMIFVSPFVIKSVIENERLNARVSTVTEFKPATRADKYRLSNIQQAFEGFQNKPIYGNGPTSFRRNNEFNKVAHSTLFSVLYELGVFGLLFLLNIFYFILKLPVELKKVKFKNPHLITLGSLMPVFIVQSFFIELLPKAPIYVALAISVASITSLKEVSGFDSGG